MAAQVDANESAETQYFKSRERVREQGEVFTQPREINAMLDLMPGAFDSLDTTFLEPAAGNGNFVIQIFRRKTSLISVEVFGGTDRWLEFAVLRALASIYAIDIDHENILQARQRMLDEVQLISVDRDCVRAAKAILNSNVVVGDSLNHPESIQFVSYKALPGERFQRSVQFLRQPDVDLFYQPPEVLPVVHFSELGS